MIKLNVKSKLVLLLCVSLLLMSAFFIMSLIATKTSVLTAEAENVHSRVSELQIKNLKGQIDTVSLSLNYYYESSKLNNIKSDLSAEVNDFREMIGNIYARNDALENREFAVYAFINEYRWNNGRYIFAYDADSVTVKAHGEKPKLIGSSVYNDKDSKGNYYARDIVSSAKDNTIGFTRYYYLNPISNKVEEKVTASFYFGPLNLVVATGEYISTLQQDKLQNALNAIGTSRYGDNGYFWVQDRHGKILAHPKAELVGRAIPQVTTVVADSLKGKAEAVSNITFENPATKIAESKVVYARKIYPEWGWTIATGAYLGDIEEVENQLIHVTKNIFDEKVYLSLFIAFGLLLLTLIVAVFAINHIVKGLTVLKERIDSLSTGEADLTSRIIVTSQDEVGDIGASVNKFIAYLQSMLLEISHASSYITSGINQLDEQSALNNKALHKHVAETEQVVAAILDMNSTAETVAQSATETAANTAQASEEAMLAKDDVVESSGSMSALVREVESTSSRINTMNENTLQIVSVLGVIGDIADQTNLLALNAAIEAARAGEQGRGFAVVADEVRSLAARTQSSTSEINDILTTLSSDANKAVSAMNMTKSSCERTAENAGRVSSNLDSMTSSIVEINDLSTQIATASEEQKAVTEEVTRNINNIREMVQELSRNGQLTIESTQNLASANMQLSSLVSKFKLK